MRRCALGKRCRNLLTKNRNAEVDPLASTKQIQTAATQSLSKRPIPVRDTVSFELLPQPNPGFVEAERALWGRRFVKRSAGGDTAELRFTLLARRRWRLGVSTDLRNSLPTSGVMGRFSTLVAGFSSA